MKRTSSWGLIEDAGEYLFIKRSEQTSRPGQWCLPGGGRERDETQEEACIREIKEEVGLDVSQAILTRQDESFFYFSCAGFDIKQPIVLKLNECVDYRWVRPDALLELGEIMELKRMVRVFSELGYEIVVPDPE